MVKEIVKVFLKKWYFIIFLIPSALIAFIISLIFAFFIANRYNSDYLGILIMNLIFSVITPTPMIIYWIYVVNNSRKKVRSILVCTLLHVLVIGLCWTLVVIFGYPPL